MDKGKKPDQSKVVSKVNTIYMDLPWIIREHALRYLPAKSLCRFRAVCRDWNRQISSPFFEHSQSFAFHSISGLFCQSPDGSISFISLDPMAFGIPDPNLKYLPEPVDLLTSSHGLLCCRGRTGEKAYYICNPVNQNWKKLPKPEAIHGHNSALVLVFEPSLLDFVADYKLICAFPSTDFDDAYEFEIYSSTEDSWKISSEVFFGNGGRIMKAHGVHLNGIIYWALNNFVIIGFDLKKNRVKVITCYELHETLTSLTLGIMDRKLCVSKRRGCVVNILVLSNEFANTMHMKAESKTWEQKTAMLKNAHASAVHDSEGILFAVGSDVILFPHGSKYFFHDRRTEETTLVRAKAEFSINNVYVPYVNSLVCL